MATGREIEWVNCFFEAAEKHMKSAESSEEVMRELKGLKGRVNIVLGGEDPRFQSMMEAALHMPEGKGKEITMAALESMTKMQGIIRRDIEAGNK